jgi:hypothetical protein
VGARRRIEAVNIDRRMGRVRVAEMGVLGNIRGDSGLMGLLEWVCLKSPGPVGERPVL